MGHCDAAMAQFSLCCPEGSTTFDLFRAGLPLGTYQ